jgi:DNA-binding GntR family transcriptional regulator
VGIITPSTLKVYLVQHLRESILSGKYRPGSRLNESTIAREFGISRIPVREALFQLQESGFVTNHKGKGMFVTRLSEEDTQMINSVRLVLETEAFKLARARITPETAAALTSLVDRMEAWKGELADSAAMDLEFHRTVWSVSGNPYLIKTLEPLTTVLFAHKTLEHVSFELHQWRLNHHRALLDVILNPAPQDIRGALLMHLRMSYNDPERFSSFVKPAPSASPRRPYSETEIAASAAGSDVESTALSGVNSEQTALPDPLRS